MSRYLRPVLRAVAMLALIAGAAGCSLVSGSGETRSVSDTANLFHFKIPASWQSSTDAGFLSVYAYKRLPKEGEEPDRLSVLVFSSQEASTAAVPEVVDRLIKARAKSRAWTDVTPGEPRELNVGGRDAYAVDVKARGADKIEFESRYIFIRTGGSEVFFVAVAPKGHAIAEFDDEIDGMTANWFWHVSPDGEALETSDTVR